MGENGREDWDGGVWLGGLCMLLFVCLGWGGLLFLSSSPIVVISSVCCFHSLVCCVDAVLFVCLPFEYSLAVEVAKAGMGG